MRIREGLAVCLALLLGWSSGAWSIVAAQQPPTQQDNAAPQPAQGQPPPAEGAKPAPPAAQLTPEQQDLATLSQAVDAAAKSGQAPSGISMRWLDNHFIRSQGGSVYVPFTIEVDRKQLSSPSAALYIRVVDKGAPAPAAGAAQPGADLKWNTLSAVTVPDNGIVSHAIALDPGTYEAFIAVKERGTGAPAGEAQTGVLRQELVVPNFGGDELAVSSVILARAIGQLAEPLPAAQQQEHPYTFVTLQVQPAHDGAFAKSGQLHLLFWIYNAAQEGGKPDVQVEYQFHHRLPDGGLKYFNKTAPQALNAETLPPEFNLTAGHQLLSNLSIPLASFAEGGYRLEITVTDKKSGKSLTRNVDFSVSA